MLPTPSHFLLTLFIVKDFKSVGKKKNLKSGTIHTCITITHLLRALPSYILNTKQVTLPIPQWP